MISLINFGNKYKTNEYDVKQSTLLNYITSMFFPWLCFTLLLNNKTQKKYVTVILILHWFLRATGDVLFSIAESFPVSNNERINNYWPYTSDRWFVGSAMASLFWLSGEIISDWYLYIRTKAVTPNSKKTILVLIICVLYNIVKIIGIVSFFIILPADCRRFDENGKAINNLLPHTMLWWSSVMVSTVISFLYDLSVIFALKTELFNKLKNYNEYSSNTFADKFKRTSELRIIISSTASIIFLPFIVMIVYNMAYYTITDFQKVMFINPEPIRQVVLNINYHLMYIDQILLKYYVKKNNTERFNGVKKNSLLLDIKSTNTENITKPEGLTTPSSISTYVFNEALYKRTTIYNINNSCESLNSVDNSSVILTVSNDNNSIKSAKTVTNNKNETNNNNIYLNDDTVNMNNECRNRINSIYTVDENVYADNGGRNRISSIYTVDENVYANNGGRNRINSIYTVDENAHTNNNGSRNRLNSLYTVDDNESTNDDGRNRINSIYTVDENAHTNNNGSRNRLNSLYTVDDNESTNNDGRNRINSIYTIDENIYKDNGGRNRFNSIYTNDSNDYKNDNQSYSKSRNNSIFTNNSMYSNNDNNTSYSNSIYSYYGNDNKNKQNPDNILSPIADVSYEEDSLMLTKL